MSRARSLQLATLALTVSLMSTACAGSELLRTGGRMPWPEYEPLTKETFADGMTDAMFRHQTVHMEMSVADESMSMDVRFGDSDDTAMAGTYDDGESVGTMVVVDGEVYFRDEGGPTYFQFPDFLADQVLAQMDMSNPREIASDFKSGIETLEYNGSHEVEYGPAHRYDVTMRKDFVAEELDLPVEEVPDFSYRIWLDDDHLVRRISATVMGTVADVRLSEWGVPVRIEAPPAHLVEPLPMPTDET